MCAVNYNSMVSYLYDYVLPECCPYSAMLWVSTEQLNGWEMLPTDIMIDCR